MDIMDRAYKKLKASVYFDKTQLILRNRIVRYEGDYRKKGNEALDRRLLEIEELLLGDDDQWNEYKRGLLQSIRVLSYPKSLVQESENIILNDSRKHIKVDRPQYFFDAEMEIQLLGVCWILEIGKMLDSEFYTHSYGNRLRKTIFEESSEEDQELEGKEHTFSPYLFKPYFGQYESWRDIALQHAEGYLDNKQDILILTLDFKNFFHSVHFRKSMFTKFYKEYMQNRNTPLIPDVMIKRLNLLVFEVIQEYSKILAVCVDINNRLVLPIGYFPSNILSNWYLDVFDDSIINRWNPIYYGRYVDDIIIVDKVEKNSYLFKMMTSLTDDSPDKNDLDDKIIKHFLVNCNADKESVCPENKLKSLFIPSGDEYVVNSKLWNVSKASITVQNNKVKLFYFKSNRSKALLTCFRNEIRNNSSEFRFLPGDDSVFKYHDYSEIYKLDNEATINKLRGVKQISIDKFSLSKFLGKYVKMGVLIKDKLESDFVKDLKKVFTPRVIIENYQLWERIFHYLVINDSYNSLLTYLETIIIAINDIEYNDSSDDRIVCFKDSLEEVIHSGLSKALSLKWNKKVYDLLHKLEKNNNFNSAFSYSILLEYRQNYCHSRMVDKYVMPVLIDVIINGNDTSNILSDDSSIDLTTLQGFLGAQLTFDFKVYKYYPYMISPQDIIMTMAVERLIMGLPLGCSSSVNLTKKLKSQYVLLNYLKSTNILGSLKELDSATHKDYSIVKVSGPKKKTFRIALANTKLSQENFVNALNGFPNKSYKRYSSLINIINGAIKNKSDILVLPESYIPFEWLPVLSRLSATNDIAIITGVEHLVVKENVYNLTAVILPYSGKGYRFAHIEFHTKVHYSPEEVRQINGYNLKHVIGTAFNLFSWKDLWFSVYCCFELASIKHRSQFQAFVDMIAIPEWNRDVNYYSNIIESLSRDMHCYCIQVNSSDYGDCRITQPSITELKDIIKTKGGINDTILIGEIDVEGLRTFQIKGYELQKEDKCFKPTPPQFNKEIVKNKLNGKLWDELQAEEYSTS